MKPDPIRELAADAEAHVEKSLRARRHGDHVIATLHARDARADLLTAETLLTLRILRDLRTARRLKTLFSLLPAVLIPLYVLSPGATDRIVLLAAAAACVALRYLSQRLADELLRMLPEPGLQTMTPEKARSDPPATI